jgi:hypothetical protein
MDFEEFRRGDGLDQIEGKVLFVKDFQPAYFHASTFTGNVVAQPSFLFQSEAHQDNNSLVTHGPVKCSTRRQRIQQ